MLSVAQLGSTRSLERPACFAPGVCVCVCLCLCIFMYNSPWLRGTQMWWQNDVVCVRLVSVAIANYNVESLTLNLIRVKSFTKHNDWTTAKTFLSVFLLIPQLISLHFSPLLLSNDLSLLLLLARFLTTCSASSIPAIQHLYWHESQMNSINKASKYKRKLTREIINKQIKHKPSDFPSVSFFCLLISIVFYLLSYFFPSFSCSFSFCPH